MEDTKPQIVADRIVDCLRLMSIASSNANNIDGDNDDDNNEVSTGSSDYFNTDPTTRINLLTN